MGAELSVATVVAVEILRKYNLMEQGELDKFCEGNCIVCGTHCGGISSSKIKPISPQLMTVVFICAWELIVRCSPAFIK